MIVCIATTVLSITGEFPCQDAAFYLEKLAAFDQLAIIKPIKVVGTETRAITDWTGVQSSETQILDCEVISAQPALSARIKVVRFETNWRVPRKPLSMTVGQKYLIISRKPRGAWHEIPTQSVLFLSEFASGTPVYGRLELKSADEINALAAFHTTASKLLKADSVPSTVLLNVARTALKANDFDSRRACAFFSCFRIPITEQVHYQRNALPYVSTNSPFIKMLLEAAESGNAANAARVLSRLISTFKINDAQVPLYAALKKLVDDPKALSDPEDDVSARIDLAIDYGATTKEERDARHMEIVDLALRARSPALRSKFFVHCGWTPDLGRQREVFKVAMQSDEDLSYFLFKYLALWNDDDDHLPKIELINKRRQFSNRNELTAYWKKALLGGSV